MTPKEYIEEFNKMFVVENGGVMPKHRDFGRTLEHDLKSFHISTVISVLKEQVEAIKHLIKDAMQIRDKYYPEVIGEPMMTEKWAEIISYKEMYNNALSDLNLSLENKIKEWEKLLNNK